MCGCRGNKFNMPYTFAYFFGVLSKNFSNITTNAESTSAPFNNASKNNTKIMWPNFVKPDTRNRF